MLNYQPVENASPSGGLAGDCDVEGLLRQFGSVHIKQAINSADVHRFGSLFDKCMRIIMSSDAGCISDDDRSLIVEFIETCGNFKLIAGYAIGLPLHDIVGAFFSPAVLEVYCDYLERDELVVSLEFAFAHVPLTLNLCRRIHRTIRTASLFVLIPSSILGLPSITQGT